MWHAAAPRRQVEPALAVGCRTLQKGEELWLLQGHVISCGHKHWVCPRATRLHGGERGRTLTIRPEALLQAAKLFQPQSPPPSECCRSSCASRRCAAFDDSTSVMAFAKERRSPRSTPSANTRVAVRITNLSIRKPDQQDDGQIKVVQDDCSTARLVVLRSSTIGRRLYLPSMLNDPHTHCGTRSSHPAR